MTDLVTLMVRAQSAQAHRLGYRAPAPRYWPEPDETEVRAVSIGPRDGDGGCAAAAPSHSSLAAWLTSPLGEVCCGPVVGEPSDRLPRVRSASSIGMEEDRTE